ncbi:MAG: hypothetical protein WD314_16210 [Trueperaceae bacterium]
MPAWLGPIFVLPALAVYPRYKLLSAAILLGLLVLMVANDGWRGSPGTNWPVKLMAMQVLVPLAIILSGLERGWFDSSPAGRSVLGGAFLLGIGVHYAFASFVLGLGVYGSNLLTFALLTILPLSMAWFWSRGRTAEE